VPYRLLETAGEVGGAASDNLLIHLLRHFNDLADAVAARLRGLLAARRDKVFQQSLLPGDGAVRLDGITEFHFDPQRYPARWLYAGRWRFNKHYYPLPGELKPEIDAEETACAIEIDGMPQVRRWVRNLERQPDAAFGCRRRATVSIPTSWPSSWTAGCSWSSTRAATGSATTIRARRTPSARCGPPRAASAACS
jgi:hypothetical protein